MAGAFRALRYRASHRHQTFRLLGIGFRIASSKNTKNDFSTALTCSNLASRHVPADRADLAAHCISTAGGGWNLKNHGEIIG
eukprot:7188986-Prymnesium_polylepis.1